MGLVLIYNLAQSLIVGIISRLLNIKGANLNSNLNQFLELNNILLFLTSMCVKMYYFNTKYVVKNNHI